MKYLFICLLTLLSNSIFSQGLTEKYSSIDISIGQKSLSTVGGAYTLDFIEESIREIQYNFKRSFDKKIKYKTFKIAAKYGRYKGLSHEIFFDVTIGDFGGGQFGYSLGYNFALEPIGFDILIRPSLGISSGDVSLFLRNFKVDTTGIVLSDNDYIDTDIEVDINDNVINISPNIEFTFLYEQKFAIALNIGYDFVVKSNTQVLSFKPSNSDYKKIKANFGNESYIFRRDNEVIKDNIFKSSSLKYSIGISTYFNKD